MKRTNKFVLGFFLLLSVISSGSANPAFRAIKFLTRPVGFYIVYKGFKGAVEGFGKSALRDGVGFLESGLFEAGGIVENKTRFFVSNSIKKWRKSSVKKQCKKVKSSVNELKCKVAIKNKK